MAISSEVLQSSSSRLALKCLSLESLQIPQTLAEPLVWYCYISWTLQSLSTWSLQSPSPWPLQSGFSVEHFFSGGHAVVQAREAQPCPDADSAGSCRTGPGLPPVALENVAVRAADGACADCDGASWGPLRGRRLILATGSVRHVENDKHLLILSINLRKPSHLWQTHGCFFRSSFRPFVSTRLEMPEATQLEDASDPCRAPRLELLHFACLVLDPPCTSLNSIRKIRTRHRALASPFACHPPEPFAWCSAVGFATESGGRHSLASPRTR